MIRKFLLILLSLALGSMPVAALGEDAADASAEEEAIECPEPEEGEEVECVMTAEEDDDTLEIETESTVDNTEAEIGLMTEGDFRPIYDFFDIDARDGTTESDDVVGFRFRTRLDYGISEAVHVGARLAGLCFQDGCDPDFVLQPDAPERTGLSQSQFTLDEFYLHWFRPKGSLAVGRLQTRFVMRSGVYAKSLDRNNSNNVNVNWTDGAQAQYRADNGWNSSFVWEYNDRDGPSSIRWDPLNFDNSTAQSTWFGGVENIDRWGPIVQRALDVSYLPKSLLVDGTKDGRREDYWGVVGRIVGRWPQRREGIRVRAGLELGYAPNTQTASAAMLEKDADGLAWDIVVSLMDFFPKHSIGINYAQTGAGWLLSPQFRPNEELFEIRYIWNPRRPYFPLLEFRIRWREDLERVVGSTKKREEFDGYLRLTWEFALKRWTPGP